MFLLLSTIPLIPTLPPLYTLYLSFCFPYILAPRYIPAKCFTRKSKTVGFEGENRNDGREDASGRKSIYTHAPPPLTPLYRFCNGIYATLPLPRRLVESSIPTIPFLFNTPRSPYALHSQRVAPLARVHDE